MKVEVENQPHCVATLKHRTAAGGSVERMGRDREQLCPRRRGSRVIAPGKAPRRVIEAKFRKEIQDELTKKLVSKSYHEAIAEKQLRVVSLTNLEDVEFGDDRSMRFRATVVTAPEFELPEYKGIPLQLPETRSDRGGGRCGGGAVARAVGRFRRCHRSAASAMEDFAVIDFEGAVDGKPISEIAPEASKNLHGGKKFWLRLAPDNFLPRFCRADDRAEA